MPPQAHALLSASSAHRWLNCPPSAMLERSFPDRETEAAAEGTAAHALAEHKLRKALRQRSTRPVSDWQSDEMETLTDEYVSFVLEKIQDAKEACPDPVIRIEEKLDFSKYVPDGFGTGDCVIVADQDLRIIDFKYGQGVLVEARENPQMMLYALGALEKYQALYDIQTVQMTIYQPRRSNIDSWGMTVRELLDWAENRLKSVAEKAAKGEGEWKPGPWCTFCKASVKCRARAEEKLALAKHEFTEPGLLTDDEIEDILSKTDDLVRWANEISEYARKQALEGKIWKGWKLVEGRSNRRYADDQKVAEAAEAAGYSDIWHKNLLTVTEMEKYMGRKAFQEILGDLITKPAGKPTLVPVDDKRPALNTINNEFMEVELYV